MAKIEFTESTAIISECEQYRYRLTRRWKDGPSILWVMLNPSIADAEQLDPTLRRCLGFSKAWGYGRMVIANIYALRSTDPKRLLKHNHNPSNRINNQYIYQEALRCKKIVLGCGSHSMARDRLSEVTHVITNLAGKKCYCLGTTQAGYPKHPLYVAGNTELVRFRFDI